MKLLPEVPDWIDAVLASVPANDTIAQRQAVYRHLSDQLQPGSFLEKLKVQEMVLTWLEIVHIRTMLVRLHHSARKAAAEHFDLVTNRQMEKLSRDLHKSPAANYRALSQNYVGIDFLIERWHTVSSFLESSYPVTLHHLFELLNAMGSSDKVNQCTEHGAFMMTCFLGFQPNIERDLNTWVYRSRMHPIDSRVAFERHMQTSLGFGSPEKSKEVFVSHLREYLRVLNLTKESLRAEHEHNRALFAEQNQTDRALVSSIRTHMGFLRLQFSRLLKLEKEFQTLQRERAREEERKQLFEARLEAARNGISPARKRRAPLMQADELNGLEEDQFIPGTPRPFFKAPDSVNFTENEIAPGEMELIGEVVASAEKYNQDTTTDEPSTGPAGDAPSAAESTLAEARKIVASLSEKELKNPFQHPGFKQVYQKARGGDRKQIMKRVEDEKARRKLLLNLQPSG